MNQPTREEFQRLEEKQRHLEEEVRQLRRRGQGWAHAAKKVEAKG